ncbi:MAG: hypothetical protein ACE14V_14490 [bacterium]
MSDGLTERDCGTLMAALTKCQILREIVKNERCKCKLCVVTEDHLKEAVQTGHILMVLPFGFPEMNVKEMDELMEKLHDLERLAWLRGQKGANNLD